MVILDCAQFEKPRVEVIEYIARLKLGLRRGDRKLCLAGVSAELAGLIELAGLSEVLLGVEVEGQAEEREQLRRIEEEGDLADPPA